MKPVFFFGVYFSNGTSFYLNTDSIELGRISTNIRDC